MVNYLGKVGRVAQLVEQCPFKAWVEGSNPSALTRFTFRQRFISSIFRQTALLIFDSSEKCATGSERRYNGGLPFFEKDFHVNNKRVFN